IEAAYHAAARRLQQALPEDLDLGPKLVPIVRWGKTYQEVLTYAVEAEIDLICMGAKGKNFSMGALFGSNVDRVLRQAPCPVLVARPLRPDLYVTPTVVDDGMRSAAAAIGKGA
ncbi:MAG: universal stress protein, partial [Pyrinomonadaceae bacterium]